MTWTNRYCHHMTVTMRAWPMTKRTLKASCAQKEFKVTGMNYTENCRMSVVHRFGTNPKHQYEWELSQEDGNRLCAIGSAGARIDRTVVKCPGSNFENVKQECWLEVDVTVYPASMEQPQKEKGNIVHGKEPEIRERVQEWWDRDWEMNRKAGRRHFGYNVRQYRPWLEAWRGERRTFTGIHYIVSKELVDFPLMARKIMEGKVILIDWRLHMNYQVQMRKIHEKLNYWVEPGRQPDEPGGEFMGYCLGRSVFWGDELDVPPEVLAEGEAAKEAYREKEKLEKRRRAIRKKFVGMTTVRVAKFYGVSQELVMKRFLETGYIDWITDEADKVAETPLPEGKGFDYVCKGPAAEAAKVLGFCIDAMAIRPPDPPPVIYTGKKLAAKLEYQRKKEDAFNKLSPEEKAKVLAERERRQRGTPQGLLKRIVARLAQEDGRQDVDALMGELTAEGITDLIINAIRTHNDRRKTKGNPDPIGQEVLVRLGTKAVRAFHTCKTGALVESWNAGRIVR